MEWFYNNRAFPPKHKECWNTEIQNCKAVFYSKRIKSVAINLLSIRYKTGSYSLEEVGYIIRRWVNSLDVNADRKSWGCGGATHVLRCPAVARVSTLSSLTLAARIIAWFTGKQKRVNKELMICEVERSGHVGGY